MKIDINSLTEAELADLNRRIVQRLRFLQQARAHERMLELGIGDRVAFEPEGRGVLTGLVTKYNKKTVTVVTDTGERWNVAPGLLHRVVEAEGNPAGDIKVVPMHRK